MPGRSRIYNPFSRSGQSKSIRYKQPDNGSDRTVPQFTPSSHMNTDASFSDELFFPPPAAHHTYMCMPAELPASLSAEEEPITIPSRIRAEPQAAPAELSSDYEVGSSSVNWEDLESELRPRLEESSVSLSPPPPYSRDPPIYDPSASMVIRESHISSTTADSLPAESEHESAQLPEESEGKWTDPITAACREIIRDNFSTSDPEFGTAEYYEYRTNVRATPNYRWYLNFRYGSLVLQADLPAQVFHVGLRQRDIRVRKQSFNQVLAYLFGDCLLFAESLFTSVMKDPNGRPGTKIPGLLRHGLNVIESWPVRFCEVKQICKKKDLNLIIDVCTHISAGVEEDIRYELKFKTFTQRQIVSSDITTWLDDRTASHQTTLAQQQENGSDSHRSPTPDENEPHDHSAVRHSSRESHRRQSRSTSRSPNHSRASTQSIRQESADNYSYLAGHDSSDEDSIPRSATSRHRRSHSPYFASGSYREATDGFVLYHSCGSSSTSPRYSAGRTHY